MNLIGRHIPWNELSGHRLPMCICTAFTWRKLYRYLELESYAANHCVWTVLTIETDWTIETVQNKNNQRKSLRSSQSEDLWQYDKIISRSSVILTATSNTIYFYNSHQNRMVLRRKTNYFYNFIIINYKSVFIFKHYSLFLSPSLFLFSFFLFDVCLFLAVDVWRILI